MIHGLGVELVEIAPFALQLAPPEAPGLALCFSEPELEYCRRMSRSGQHLAARYAAKVATLKAIGLCAEHNELLRAVEVVKIPSGRPCIELTEPLSSRAASFGISRLHLSVSHSGGYAVAMVVAEGR